MRVGGRREGWTLAGTERVKGSERNRSERAPSRPLLGLQHFVRGFNWYESTQAFPSGRVVCGCTSLGGVCRFEEMQVTFVPVLRLLGAIWSFEVEERVKECSKCQGS